MSAQRCAESKTSLNEYQISQFTLHILNEIVSTTLDLMCVRFSPSHIPYDVEFFFLLLSIKRNLSKYDEEASYDDDERTFLFKKKKKKKVNCFSTP